MRPVLKLYLNIMFVFIFRLSALNISVILLYVSVIRKTELCSFHSTDIHASQGQCTPRIVEGSSRLFFGHIISFQDVCHHRFHTLIRCVVNPVLKFRPLFACEQIQSCIVPLVLKVLQPVVSWHIETSLSCVYRSAKDTHSQTR